MLTTQLFNQIIYSMKLYVYTNKYFISTVYIYLYKIVFKYVLNVLDTFQNIFFPPLVFSCYLLCILVPVTGLYMYIFTVTRMDRF